MTLLFARCTHCGKHVEDSTVLMAARHFPWECPFCGKDNAPLLQGTHQDSITPEDPEEEMTTDNRGLTGEGTLLFKVDDGPDPAPGRGGNGQKPS